MNARGHHVKDTLWLNAGDVIVYAFDANPELVLEVTSSWDGGVWVKSLDLVQGDVLSMGYAPFDTVSVI